MRHMLSLTIGAVTLCAATGALAQEKKFQFGLRTGYSLPMGSAVGSGTSSVGGTTITFRETSLSDVFKYQVPIWLEAGYLVTPNIMLGVYFQYAFMGVKSASAVGGPGCQSGTDCSAHGINYGIQAQYQFSPGQTLNPWLGFGFGRETAYTSTTTAGTTSDGSFSGWEFARFQGGLDFTAADGVGIGPFVSLSLAQYSNMHAESNGIGADVDMPGALHEWLTLGVRGAFSL